MNLLSSSERRRDVIAIALIAVVLLIPVPGLLR